MHKTVKYLIPAVDVDMGGILLKQAIPTQRIDQIDPFLLLHHADFNYTADAPARHQGIGPHPHRGFSPVTFVIDGEVHHRDSRGNNQIARKGEVQWMHAGAGIVHSERPSQELVDKNGRQEIIQLWINTPAEKKMTPPSYQYIPKEEIPVFSSENGEIQNKLIAGNISGLQGKIKTETDLLIIWCMAKTGSSETYTIDNRYNTMLYLIKGTLRITGFGKVLEKSLLVFENDAEQIEVSADSDAQFLILSGEPIGEKTVQRGPFVMNSMTEIMKAMRDYQMGKMGILIEE